MKKKLLITGGMLLAAVIFTGCGKTKAAEPAKAEPAEVTTSSIKNDPPTTPGITTDDLIQKVAGNDFSHLSTYGIDGYAVDRIACTANYGVTAYKKDASDSISALMTFAEKGMTTVPMAEKFIKEASVLCREDYNEIERDGKTVFYIAIDADFDPNAVPFLLKDLNKDDLFSSEERCSAYEEYVKTGNYQGLSDLVSQYISENSPGESDSVYFVQDRLSEILPVIDKCEFVPDEIEGTTTIYCNGVRDLSDSINVVPSYDTSDNMPVLTLGFTVSDWVFFDKIEIKTNADLITKAYDVNDLARDVIDGGVSEKAVYEPKGDEWDKISSIQAIRFANSKDPSKVRDHELSDAEKDALNTIAVFKGSKNYFSNLEYNYLNN